MGDYDIGLADFPRLRVLSSRAKGPVAEFGKRLGSLFGQAAARRLRPSGPPFAIYYGPPEGGVFDFEVCLPVEGGGGTAEGLRELGGEACVKALLRGPYAGLNSLYKAVQDWAAAEGRSLGPESREVYLRGPLFGFIQVGLLTELYWPLA